MELFIQRIFDGMFNSAIYASLAIAVVVIYRATGLLNFAQGELATFSAYIGFLLLSPTGVALTGSGLVSVLPGLPWPVPLAILGAVLFGSAMGALAERILIRPLEGRTELSVVNVTIGMLIAINALTLEFWGTRPRLFPSPFPHEIDDYFSVAGARLRFESIGVWFTLLLLLVILALFLQHTKAGLSFRAITGNRESAQLCGIRVGRTLMYGWAVAAGLGALAATLVADVVLLEPFMMLRLLIYSFAAATIGGLDSPGGAVVGGIIVGLTQSLVPGYVPFIPSELSLLPALLAMLVVLLIRPTGLFGTKRVERV
ncbi:MAG: branched-chain amino acid ABC transporter permease [Actinomycetia bacterium]|nr:branched-chain amino acid ABC transporter permease [Actinomycetes bacterium]MCP4086648.1 branched-chain amino acid ABC transporter permease [Actinomycetes bacterium]